MPKSLKEKLETKLKEKSYMLDNYLGEIETLSLSKQSKNFTQGELNHITRLIENSTSDLLYYFYGYMGLPKNKRTAGSLEILTLRHGRPDLAEEIYEKQIKKNSDTVREAYANMPKEEYKRKKPQYIEFYLDRYDEQTAYEKFAEYLRNRTIISREAVKKSNDYRRNNPTSNNAHIDFYLAKHNGNRELAEQEYKERQGVGSLKNYIKRYGEKEGYNKWQSRQRKWQNTLNSKPLDEQDRVNRLKVTKGFPNNVSKESIKFFDRLNEDISYELIYGNKTEEFSICYNGKNRYYYDCLIPELGIIIEYHGTGFHPKPMDYDWTNRVNGSEYRKARLADLRKRKVAIDQGYTYIIIWSDYTYERALYKIKEAINARFAQSLLTD